MGRWSVSLVLGGVIIALGAIALPLPTPDANQEKTAALLRPEPATTPPPSVSANPPAVTVLVENPPASGRFILRAVDPGTLQDLPNRAPLDLGNSYGHNTAFSPDGRTLAAVVWSQEGGNLHLIDLPTWTERPTGIQFDSGLQSIDFHPDGESFYWFRFRDLHRYDIVTGTASLIGKLSRYIQFGEMRILPSGSRVALFGFSPSCDGNSPCVNLPHVVLVDLSSARVVYALRLDGVRFGTLEGEGDEPRVYSPALAWDLPRNRLYIVHGAGDRVTIVDLAEGRVVQEGTVEPRLSLGERIGRRLFPVARAKLVPGVSLRAAVSADGSLLYVTGQRGDFIQQPDGTTFFRQTPLGLSVISTRDLTEQGRLDLPVSQLRLSPDGRYVLLAGRREDIAVDGPIMESAGSGLYVLEAARLHQLAHLNPDDTFTLYGFSPDGLYAYVHQAGDTGRFRVLDLASRRFVAEREYPAGSWAYPLTP